MSYPEYSPKRFTWEGKLRFFHRATFGLGLEIKVHDKCWALLTIFNILFEIIFTGCLYAVGVCYSFADDDFLTPLIRWFSRTN